MELDGHVFRRAGQDVFVDVGISAEEAAAGFSRQLNTPAGEAITVAREGPTDDG